MPEQGPGCHESANSGRSAIQNQGGTHRSPQHEAHIWRHLGLAPMLECHFTGGLQPKMTRKWPTMARGMQAIIPRSWRPMHAVPDRGGRPPLTFFGLFFLAAFFLDLPRLPPPLVSGQHRLMSAQCLSPYLLRMEEACALNLTQVAGRASHRHEFQRIPEFLKILNHQMPSSTVFSSSFARAHQISGREAESAKVHT